MSVITLNPAERAVTPADLVWETPPARKSRPGVYTAVAAALRDKPGQWAVVRTYTSQQRRRAWHFVTVVNSGRLIDFRANLAGRFEAVARTVDDGTTRCYVRYLPGIDTTGGAR